MDIEILTMNDPDNGSVQAYYCKGWQDKHEFASLVSRGEGIVVWHESIRHVYLRYGVASFDGEPMQVMFEYNEPGPGRFKATVAYSQEYA